MMMKKMNIKRFRHGIPLPKRQTEGAVGYDLSAAELYHKLTMKGDGSILIPTGFGFEVPPGHVGMIVPRSSTAHFVLPGYVDPDYRGEVFVKTTQNLMYQLGAKWDWGDRIAQLIIVPVMTPVLVEVEELSQTARGDGGHGSTGTNGK